MDGIAEVVLTTYSGRPDISEFGLSLVFGSFEIPNRLILGSTVAWLLANFAYQGGWKLFR